MSVLPTPMTVIPMLSVSIMLALICAFANLDLSSRLMENPVQVSMHDIMMHMHML